MFKISKATGLWRRIPRSFKRQFVLVVFLFGITVAILIFMYPRSKEEASMVSKSPATVFTEVYQQNTYALNTELQFYNIGNRTKLLFRGWSWENISMQSGNYDILIDYYGYKQEFYNITINPGENHLKLNVPAGTLIINASFATEPAVIDMEVYLSDDRVRPIVLCKSDLKLILPPGEYDIRFLWAGNEEWLEGISIVNEQVLVKNYQLKRHAL
jgi:hypothetical protein